MKNEQANPLHSKPQQLDAKQYYFNANFPIPFFVGEGLALSVIENLISLVYLSVVTTSHGCC